LCFFGLPRGGALYFLTASIGEVTGRPRFMRLWSKSKSRSGDKFCRYCKDNDVISEYWKLQNKEKRDDTSTSKGKLEDGTALVVSMIIQIPGSVLVAFAGCTSEDVEWR
jgi:hypothetical protein